MKLFKANRKCSGGRIYSELSGLFTRAKSFGTHLYAAIDGNSVNKKGV